jgi:cytochrome P450
MFHDPDFMPFEPPKGRANLSAGLKNFLTAFPASAYEEPFTLLRNSWPFADLALVADPELIEELLIARMDEFPHDSAINQALGPATGRGSLLLAEGADWKWQRRAIAPAFRHENLLDLTPSFAAHAQRRVELWRKQSGRGVLDVSDAMTQTTFDIILDAVLGGAAAFDRDRYLTALDTALKGMPWRITLAMVGLPASFPHPGGARARRADEYAHGEIAKLAAARKAAPSDRKDMLSLLIAARDPETGQTMTEAQVIANLASLIAAGHKTSATALALTLWLLAKDQATQERVRAEVAQVADGADIGAQNVERLVFTRQVAQEAMRLFPPFPAFGRQAREDTVLGPHRISKKTLIAVPIWLLHRHKRLWDEPYGFEPDRFTPENAKSRHRCAYLPFGAGPRICIGMNFAMLKIVTILATLVREFRFSPAPGFKLELSTHLTLRSRNGLPLIVEPIRVQRPKTEFARERTTAEPNERMMAASSN